MDATFDKYGFTFHGGYLHYRGRFVARFKYARAPFGKATFLKQLRKRFTPATYFAALDAGVAPLQVLMNDDRAWYEGVLHEQRLKYGTL